MSGALALSGLLLLAPAGAKGAPRALLLAGAALLALAALAELQRPEGRGMARVGRLPPAISNGRPPAASGELLRIVRGEEAAR